MLKMENGERARLSVVIIAYNEEHNIERALKSVAWADEIVVVDSQSTDQTVDICRRYTNKVITHPWQGHIPQKNFALAQAANEWVLSIDADEEVSPELANSIKQILAQGPKFDGYMVRRKVFYLGKWIKHSGWYPDYRIRLVRKERARWGGESVHDVLEVNGSVAKISDGDLYHYSYRDLSDHISKIDGYTTIMAKSKFETGKRAHWYDMVFRPLFGFFKKYIFRLGFLDGVHGLIICALTSYYVFLKYLKLWALQKSK